MEPCIYADQNFVVWIIVIILYYPDKCQNADNCSSWAGFESDSVFKGHINARRQKKYNRLVREGETDVEGEEEVKEGDGGLILKGILKQEDQFQILIKVTVYIKYSL